MRFLSPEWLERLAAAAASSDALRRASADVDLAIRQVVTGAPGGDVDYVVRLDRGVVTIRPGPAAADVEVIEDYATAAAISQGVLTPSAAFATGRLKLGGRVGLLVEHSSVFGALSGLFAAVRAGTTY